MNRDPANAARRTLLTAGLAMPALLLPGMREAWAQAGELPATPMCGQPTARDYEGPFYKPNTPLRSSLLEPGLSGGRLVVSGFVLTRGCKPLSGAVLDFWHCDDRGDYDNAGFRLRGHQFTDDAGRYRLETIYPAEYPGRTRHIHVKVQAKEGGPLLTTQLYFPGNASNDDDSMFKPALLMKLSETGGARYGRFDFVLNVA